MPASLEAKGAASARRMRVYEKRLRGMSTYQIARQEGTTQSLIWRDIKTLRRAKPEGLDDIEDLRDLALERIRSKLSAWWDKADNDPKAMDILMRLWDFEARILGLYAPSEQNIRVDSRPQISLNIMPMSATSPSLPEPKIIDAVQETLAALNEDKT